ncbi:MAG: molecular chaperone HtpG [Synergistaceae bacterium]|nr:molecular chaperone HtpG [Synergistaceae bacterium]
MAQEKHFFQSEAAELLKMMIHSVYSNREIFLRELISNASDALDKRRIEVLSNSEEYGAYEPQIRVLRDKENRTLTILDNGIGMSREEIVEYIGTIARSGTKEFLSAAGRNGSSSAREMLIGQFGVGFYSAFMVADRVELVSRRLGATEAWRFESTGDGSYSLEEATLPECGTSVKLFLRAAGEDEKDWVDEWVLRDIIRKYSDFIAWPISMNCSKWKDGAESVEDEVVNSRKAIWSRPEGEVTEDEYREFYRHLSHDWQEPLARLALNAEGSVNFRGLLFIPSQASFDIFMNEKSGGVSLYIGRVFIMNDCKDLIPEYLRFIRGVIDSEDLPLNISREILQEDPRVRVIRRSTLRKIFSSLRKMLEGEREKYEKFWSAFGGLFKQGVIQDRENAQTILELALFRSTFTMQPDSSENAEVKDAEKDKKSEWTTLDDCIKRMKPEQEGLYYITGRDASALRNSPKLEAFAEKGYEVLLLADPVDEFIMAQNSEYAEKKFLNVGSAEVQATGESERKEAEKKLDGLQGAFEPLKKQVMAALSDVLSDVRLSTRMKSSPACLVGDENAVSMQMEQLMRAMGREVPVARRVFELNPEHPVVRRLMSMAGAGNAETGDFISTLYDQALILDGGSLPDPGGFARRLSRIMDMALGENSKPAP